MILVDTSVWIDHLRHSDTALVSLLNAGQVLGHPMVLGELAMGNLKPREIVLHSLSLLPQAVVAKHKEILAFIATHKLHGLGIGYIDAHLLASAQLSSHCKLWTRDQRLRSAAQRLHLSYL